jgi:hypothetical protein
VRRLPQAHPLVSFFVLSYTVTWLLWTPTTAALAALIIGRLTHRRPSYPRYRYEAEHLDLGRPIGRR